MPARSVLSLFLPLLLAPVLSAGCTPSAAGDAAVAGAASPAPPAKRQEQEVAGRLEVGGVTRTYQARLPGGDTPAPMVIALHGKGSSAAEMASTTALTEAVAEQGMGVAYPDGLHGGWGDHREPTRLRPDPDADVEFLLALADRLVGEHGADPDRIYLAGMSNGGNMALRTGAEHSDRFAGVAAVAGQLGADPAPQQPTGAVPLLLVYGTDDPLRPYDGLPDSPAATEDFAEPPIASIGAPATAAAFAKAGNAQRLVGDELPDREPGDGTTVERATWYAPEGEPQVVFYTVRGGGHTWPGGRTLHPDVQGATSKDFEAGKAIAEFFATH